MTNFSEQFTQINAEREALLQREAAFRQESIETARAIIKTLGLTPEDVGFTAADFKGPAKRVQKRAPKAAVSQKVAPKYALPDGSAKWSGRGQLPKTFREWIAVHGGSKEDFLIK